VNVGRSRNADPRWLLPLLCRRGQVSKPEIGKIRILAAETHFQVARRAAQRFGRAAQRPDEKDPQIHIAEL
jgi:ATP-dependent RNA helicase DeaD